MVFSLKHIVVFAFPVAAVVKRQVLDYQVSISAFQLMKHPKSDNKNLFSLLHESKRKKNIFDIFYIISIFKSTYQLVISIARTI